MILMNDLQVAACRARGDAMLHQTAVLVIMIMMRCGGGGGCCGENLLMCCGSRKGGQRGRRPERERNLLVYEKAEGEHQRCLYTDCTEIQLSGAEFCCGFGPCALSRNRTETGSKSE